MPAGEVPGDDGGRIPGPPATRGREDDGGSPDPGQKESEGPERRRGDGKKNRGRREGGRGEGKPLGGILGPSMTPL